MGPQYIPSWEGHHTSELVGSYPLQLVSPHPRFSFHTMGDGKGSWTDDVGDHRVLIDGHHYWILRLNSRDAEARGIAEGDLVARLQRPRRRDPRGAGHRARRSRHRALLRVGRRLPSRWASPATRRTSPAASTSSRPSASSPRPPRAWRPTPASSRWRSGSGRRPEQSHHTRRGRAATMNPIITASLTGPAATSKQTPAMPQHPGGDRAERQGGLRGRRRRHPHPPARERRLHHRPRRGAAHRRPGARGVPGHRAALHRRRHGLRGPRADRRGQAGHGHAEPRHHDHRRPRVPQPAAADVQARRAHARAGHQGRGGDVRHRPPRPHVRTGPSA